MSRPAPTLTESLAAYWASARYEDLPPETVRLAKRFLIDTLAAGIAGAGTDVASIVLQTLGVPSSAAASVRAAPAEGASGAVRAEPAHTRTIAAGAASI